ncbi:MAG: nicotinate-nucleotide adenylyltransferase [Candidatus Neomarinimicrobiota bacterium]
MRICLFGGTFDPPHVGHLIIGRIVKESEDFDRMIFVPAFVPPLKSRSRVSSTKERLEMLRLCLDRDKDFELSSVEINRGGISYTLETIREVKSHYRPDSSELHFLMGSDSLLDFHLWKDYEKILKECQVLVAARPGFRASQISPQILSRIRFVRAPQIEISSSQIRQRIRDGLTVRYMVLDPVWEFIKEHGLYG